MRVLIAGSSGLIGSALVAALRRDDHQVGRLVRHAPAGADEHRWNPPAGEIEPGALDGADAVVNFCGAGIAQRRWTEARKQVLRDSRETPTEVLAAAVAEHGIPLLVNASAVGYYGDTGDAVVTETTPAGAGFLAGLCQLWEAASAPAREAGARVVHLRTGLVLASGGGLLGPIRTLFSLGLGGKLGNGQQYMPWISLTDEIRAIQHLLTGSAVDGPVNLTGPGPVTNTEFTKVLGGVLHRPAPWWVPGFALSAVLGEFAQEGVLAGQRAVPRVLEQDGFQFAHPDLRAALGAALGE
jgi:uncharacterized protein (TIGR01777 family)